MPDIIVIGGGTGGVAAAIRATQLGASVTMIEQAELGGNCVNRNCIPLTSMLASVELFRRIGRAGEMGIEVGQASLNPAKVVKRARQVSDDLREGLSALLPVCGVEVVAGTARLAGPKTVAVNGQTLQAERAIVIATGARWAAPPEGIDPDAVTTPHQAMNLEPLPGHALILGGGPVELEFATLYAALGCKATLVIDGAYPLPAEDYDIGQRLQGALREQGIQMFTNAVIKSAVKTGSGVQAVIASRKGETELTVDQLLWAGRRPNTVGLGLAEVGVKLDAERGGAVVVDPHQQSSVPGIYAVGDVVGAPFYSSVATVEGLIAAENALGRPRQLDRLLLPRFAFTIPEVGCVGLTEDQAEEAGYELEVINIALDSNSRAGGLNETEGGIKLVANKKQGKILGAHIIGHRATELVAEAALAIQLEALAEDWAWAVRVHPTLSESMVEAGRAVLGQALYIPPM